MLKKICAAVGGFVIRSFNDTGRIMQLFLDTDSRLKNADARETIRQMSRLGADSLPIVLMTILFTGMVFALQTATEFVRFGAASSVGGIVAIALGRELVPVLTGVVVAGRIGAAIAAALGTMKVTERIDAFTVMATNPITYLVVPRFLAAVLMMPVLIVFANGIGNIGGWVVAHYYAGISNFTYVNSITVFADLFDVTGVMLKSMVFVGIFSFVANNTCLAAKPASDGIGLSNQ